MSAIAVVQARMGSTRFPGKVAHEVGGRPLLGWTLARLATAPVDEVVVATTTSAADDVVAQIAGDHGRPVVRGPEADVLGRMALALDTHPGATSLVRITADCPLVDPGVVGEALDVHRRRSADYTSNTLIRTYPDGLDVEVVDVRAFRQACAEASAPIEREHVTPFLYRRPERFALAGLRSGSRLGRERWTIDAPDDLDVLERALQRLSDPVRAGWREVLAAVGQRAVADRFVLRPAETSDSAMVLAWRNDPAAVAFSESGAVSPADHERWFAEVVDDPGRRLWIAELDGVPVAQVRVDVTSAVGTVSIAVDPGRRGEGLGRRTLDALETALRADAQVARVVARVDAGNAASLALFRGAGFVEQGRDGDVVVLARQR